MGDEGLPSSAIFDFLPEPAVEETPFRREFVLPPSQMFQNIRYYTARYPWFGPATSEQMKDNCFFVLPTLYTVCAEWLVLCHKIKQCLSCYETKYHVHDTILTQDRRYWRSESNWRGYLPQWKNMVDETLEQVIAAEDKYATSSKAKEMFVDLISDFKRIQSMMSEFQVRVDRIETRKIAAQQHEAATQSVAESHRVTRLTWLATIFIPLTFVSSLFSMTDDVGRIMGTFRMYFGIAVPLAIASLLVIRWGSPAVKPIYEYTLILKFYMQIYFTRFREPLRQKREERKRAAMGLD
ncbi:hypothetical protein T440DRAFT_110419 [Plenodomus tracheiphilus IPT5]|uniref:Uncharacterized protein n=1 Tax=Plenodomus tracheiphilus IPT5 TaxID=1408161 RepID=A0A6A7B7N0_9PLEO|nr:hypothetical protein T440DRAFT_110419 [Plenodomus tracheiphilus IPT5]